MELDGAQHLGDPVAYRRDRRKDLLLQENGYVVLRFLAEDVGKELDLVLDTISEIADWRSRSGVARRRWRRESGSPIPPPTSRPK